MLPNAATAENNETPRSGLLTWLNIIQSINKQSEADSPCTRHCTSSNWCTSSKYNLSGKMMFALISLILVAFVSGQPRNIRHHGRDGPAAWVKARQPPQQNNVVQNVQSYVDSSGIEDFDSEYSKPNTIDLSCHHGGHPVCCSIADDNPDSSPAMSPYYPRQAPTPLTKEGFCTVQKEYIPSKYEEIHFAKVKEVNGKFHDERRRREEYTDFIFDDIPHAIKWMNRVQYHMKLREIPGSRSEQDISDDEYYLSKFKVTRTCQQSSSSSATSEVFYEYIEPLTIYGRHPYGIIACAKDVFKRIGDEIHYKGKSVTIPFKVSKQSRDYVLLANVNYPYYNSSFYQVNEEGSTVTKLKPRKRFLFDAGSKTFDSSLFWFVCGYLQVSQFDNDDSHSHYFLLIFLFFFSFFSVVLTLIRFMHGNYITLPHQNIGVKYQRSYYLTSISIMKQYNLVQMIFNQL